MWFLLIFLKLGDFYWFFCHKFFTGCFKFFLYSNKGQISQNFMLTYLWFKVNTLWDLIFSAFVCEHCTFIFLRGPIGGFQSWVPPSFWVGPSHIPFSYLPWVRFMMAYFWGRTSLVYQRHHGYLKNHSFQKISKVKLEIKILPKWLECSKMYVALKCC